MGGPPDGSTEPRALLHSRFEPRGFLGEGAFGCVLRVHDCALKTEVAFKELTRMGGAALLRFKNEFRSLADVSHPNLVRLHELFEERGSWGFSMELIDGPDFLGFVRDAGHVHEARLRAALRQLTEGLSALHALGLTHRDVKPSNVRVTRDGRVVLLDFGLVTPTADDKSPNAGLGTLEYMAPEQARSERVGAAADFYALGVMLYEALTGALPFQGSLMQVVLAKQCQRPVEPSRHAAGTPADLEALCMALLEPDPERRAGRDDVLAVTGEPLLPPHVQPRSADLFVGREAELALAEQSYQRTLEQGLELLLIEGESGIGKTTLARAFTERLENGRDPPLVLAGRCHAAEQLPFKLFDGVVDELSMELARLPAGELAPLLPARASALATLFPVLAQVTQQRRSSEYGDFSRVERAESFELFAELLARFARRRPLVLRVDDLQWSDIDSLALLAALLDSKAVPRVLLVVTTRALDTLEPPLGPLVRELAQRRAVARIVLAPLSAEQASLLSARCLGSAPDDPRAQRVAREAQGHPLFITELAERVTALPDAAPTSLDDALRARIAGLGTTARHALDLLAVSSAPVPTAVLASGLRAPGDELARALLELRTTRWARSSRRGDLTCYHDRLREFALGLLSSDERRAHHRLLAQAFGARGDADPGEVARHLLGAGDAAAALPWLERAAEAALEQQAFERAAELYGSLLAHGGELLAPARVHAARVALSDALASAGRSAQAAAVLVDGLAQASPRERLEREGRAARQLLRAGLPREGLDAARRALAHVGLGWPGSETATLARLLWHRADLALTRTRPLTRRAHGPQRTAQLDTLWGLWQPLGWADMLRGAELGARHLRLALRSGDARHLGLALCSEAVLEAMNHPTSPRAQRLLERASAELALCQAPDLAAFHALAAGAVALFQSDFARSEEHLRESELRFARDVPGDPWQLINVRGALLSLWMNRGDFALGAARAEAWLLEARARSDSFAFATYAVTSYGCFRHAMRDDPAAALAEIDAAMAPWEPSRFGLQHFGDATARHVVLGYQSAEGPYEFWRRSWPAVRRSFLFRAGFVRVVLSAMYGESCLRAALVQQGARRLQLLREARRILTPLCQTPGRLSQACGLSILGQVEAAEGRRELALQMTARALEHWREVGNLSPYPCSVLVAWLGGDRREAEAATARALRWFAQQGWQDPRRALQTWLPALDLLEQL